MEEWRQVLDGYYSVSNLGNVRREKEGENTFAGRLKKASLSGNGYMIFGAFLNGKRTNVLLHRAVAEAFLGKCPHGYQVNHIDGNKKNNNINNLEYLTPSDNQKHALKNGLSALPSDRARGKKHWTNLHPELVAKGDYNGARKHPERIVRGSGCKSSKLTEEKVKAIKILIRDGNLSNSAIARMFGVTHNNIQFIKKGKSWNHVE